jgi:hypothetical protein
MYPLNPKSKEGYHFLDERDNRHETSLEGFMDCYSTGGDAFWGVYQAGADLKKGDYIWAHFALPISAISAVGRVLGPAFHDPSHATPLTVGIRWDWELTHRLQEHPIPYAAHRQTVPVSVRRMNSKTQGVVDNWLNRKYPPSKKFVSKKVKFKFVEVAQRQGQPEFRQALLIAYKNKCAISDCNVRDALQAAHIKTVKSGGTHSINNGLILRADIHNLFDRGLITISPNYVVKVHEDIRDSHYWKFHGKKLPLVAKNASKTALAFHQRSHKSG